MRTYRSETNVAKLEDVGNWSSSEVIFDQLKALSNHPHGTKTGPNMPFPRVS